MNTKQTQNLYTKQTRNFLFSVGLVLLFSVGLVESVRAQEASFYLSPTSGNYKVGETFSVTLFINTQGVSINASQAKIIFPPEKLKVINISKSGSILPFGFKNPSFQTKKAKFLLEAGCRVRGT